jgi:hypothetical protein
MKQPQQPSNQPTPPTFPEMLTLYRDEFFWEYYYPDETERAIAQTEFELNTHGGIENYLDEISGRTQV